MSQDVDAKGPQTTAIDPAEVSLAVDLGGLKMKNPVTDASGTFAAGREYSQFFPLERLGAVTTKGVASVPWKGNDVPRIAEIPSGVINCIGLQNPGMRALREGDLAWLGTQNVPIIVNVAGHKASEYREVIDFMEDDPHVSAYEVNISCPNVDAGGAALGTDPKAAAECVSLCRKGTKRPLIVKLTPNVTDITVIAQAVADAGADAVSMINSPKGMAIDAKTRRPKLSRVVGGMSGPAVKPIALRMVWQVHNAVDIPILGIGGICCGTDAVEFMLAGATAVGVGSASFANPHATVDVVEGIRAYCAEQGVRDVNELVGGLVC